MFSLSLEEKKELLQLARYYLEEEMDVVVNFLAITPVILEKYSEKFGVFVSLYKKDELRACLGKMNSNLPLYNTLRQMAIAVATKDYRFKPITKKEVPELQIEVSIVSPMQKIDSISKIELGKHGIYIEKDGLTGTFLPQVAGNYDWNIEEFLGHCSESKVGIAWDGWKTANIFIYETVVFKESEN